MAVAIECGLNRGMPELRLNVLRVGAVGDQETRIGMAEVVEAHPAEASAPERLRELPVTEVIRVEGRASLATKDKLTASCGRQPAEGRLERRRHVNGSAGTPGLRRPERAAPERPADVNQVCRKVNVLPQQSKELTLPHPGQGRHQQQRPQRLLLSIEQPTDLLRGEDVHLLVFTPRPRTAPG